MEEKRQLAMASLRKSPSKVRFLEQVKQLDSDENHQFELEESDVIWSSYFSSDLPPNHDSGDPISPPVMSNSPINQPPHTFRKEKFGLSAALSNDPLPLVQRKPALNPSLSATSAARTIPPVAIPRSGSGSDDSSFTASTTKYPQSAPVNVPVWPHKGNGALGSTRFEFYDEDDEEEEEMLPPHEIVARSHIMTFSVFEGAGRTLKGRDLRSVRNAVWQKTGFQD